MNIIKAPIESVIPWDKNPRGIKTKDYDRLKKQITKLGVYKPLIAFKEDGKYIVLGGNMRIRALKDMGLKEVDISVVAPKTEAEKIEFALSDNDRAGFYEEDKLAELVYPHIKDIELGDFKVDLGEALDLKQVVERYGPDIDDGADDVPEVDDTPAVTKLGDLFTLGRHRVMCGDSTKAKDVARLLGGARPFLMVTDPPYGVDYSPEWREEAAKKGQIRGGAKAMGKVVNDDEADWTPAWRLSPATVIYCWHSALHVSETQASLESANYEIRCQIIWKKPFAPISRGAYRWQHEPCWYAVRKGSAAQWIGDHTASTIWEIANRTFQGGRGEPEDAITGHGTQKPIECMARPIRNHSAPEVYDPFLGSGTTLVAAEKLNRTCFGMEIDPKYCDVIIKRYADYVGVSEENIRKTRENPNG